MIGGGRRSLCTWLVPGHRRVRLVLAQTEVAAGSNEITAIPELLQLLELSGCIVSIDAIGCQKAIAQQITESDADYVLALKQNQPQLYEAVETMFRLERQNGFADLRLDSCQTVEKDHGRIETRRCWVTSDPEFLAYMDPDQEWAQLQSLVMGRSETATARPHLAGNSLLHLPACLPMPNCFWLPPADTGASKTRSTGSWMSPFARTTAASARAMHSITWPSLRRLALNLLRNEKSAKVGIAAKRKRARMEN